MISICDEFINDIKKYKYSVLSLNIQSLSKHFSDLKLLLSELENPSIVALQEIWNPNFVKFPGYQIAAINTRVHKRGGGTAILVSNELSFRNVQNIPKCNHIEISSVEIIESHSSFIIVSLYRAPNSKIQNCLQEITHVLEYLHNTKKPYMLVGDFNINILKKDNISQKYLGIIDDFFLRQIITEPTRITANSKTLIDHCIVNEKLDPEITVISASITDHLPFLAFWGTKHKINNSEKKTNQIIDYKKLEDELKNDKFVMPENLNPNESFESFHNYIIDKVNKSKKQVKHKFIPKNPWYSKEARSLKIKLDKQRNKFHKRNSPENEALLKELKKNYTKQIRKDKMTYFYNKLKDCNGNSKLIWQTINEVLSRKSVDKIQTEIIKYNGIRYQGKEKIAQAFNNYYINIATNITNSIQSSSNSAKFYLNAAVCPTNTFDLKQISKEEVKKQINDLKNKNSEGPYGISNKTLKKISPYIIDNLTFYINQSFLTSEFPKALKIAKITPLYKMKGEKDDIEFWRPISQLSPISKIYETCAINQLYEFYEENKILDQMQFGFRPSHSTIHPLMLMRDFVEASKAKQHHVILISIDAVKAFDCVKTDGLLQEKVKYYTNNGNFTVWIDSYYKDRHQFTEWNNHKSEIQKCHQISIVQGSNLGPKLFNTFINDLPKVSKSFTIFFADDSSLLISHKNLDTLEKIANEELSKIQDYFNANSLSISIKKTTYMHIKPGNKTYRKLDIKLDKATLDENENLSFLGVTFDNKFSFKPQFKNIFSKVKKGFGALILAKNFLDYRSKLLIYHSLVHSHLSYGALVWLPSIRAKELKSLKIIQKKCLRIVFNSNYNTHTGKLFQLSGITKVENIVKREASIISYKFFNNELPSAIDSLIKTYSNASDRQTRHSDQTVFRISNKLKSHRMMYKIMDNWNKLNHKVKKSNNLKTFKNIIRAEMNDYDECTLQRCRSCNFSTRRAVRAMKL